MYSPCPDKESCGSCGWSHIPYEKQLKQKLSDINGSFALHDVNIHVSEIIPSPSTDHYRNRMDFVIDFEGRVGLRMKGKWWKVLDGHTCFIADKHIEQLFASVRTWVHECGLTFHDRKSHMGLLRYAVIRATTIGETMIHIITSAPESPQERNEALDALNVLAESSSATTVVWGINNTISDVSVADEHIVVSGPGIIHEVIGDYTYTISPEAFFQTNSHGAQLLMETVYSFLKDENYNKALDLYCGSGFFSLPLTKVSKEVVGIEVNRDAISDAKMNAKNNAVKIQFIDAKTEDTDWKSMNADLIIIDPPRSGMHDNALRDLLEAKPKHLLYVSCNYKQLARELPQLLQHYNLTHIKAVDMFPHTPHVETVAKFTLR